MKKKIVTGLIKFGLLVAMIAVIVNQPAKAQSLSYGLRVSIPFDFKVGDKTFPAGRYFVSRAQQDEAVIKITSWNGKANSFRPTIPVTIAKTSNQATVIFNRYGDQYYLSQVWPGGSSVGREVPVSRSERDLRNQIHNSVGEAVRQEPETVTIAADLP